MSRRSRLLRALARYCARVHATEARDGWHPLGPLDRWSEARWWLSTLDATEALPDAAGASLAVDVAHRARATGGG